MGKPKSLKTLWEKEKLLNEQFPLFPQCFLPVLRIFCLFHQIWNCHLQTVSASKRLNFVIWERVTLYSESPNIYVSFVCLFVHSVSSSLELLRKIPLLPGLSPSSFEGASADITLKSTLFDWISSQVLWFLLFTIFLTNKHLTSSISLPNNAMLFLHVRGSVKNKWALPNKFLNYVVNKLRAYSPSK